MTWPWSWRHFEPSGRERGWPGHPYCHTDIYRSLAPSVAEVHELACTAGPMIALYEWQHDRCALCGGMIPLRSTVADHAHSTGLVRGLLCYGCNARESHHHGHEELRNQALDRYLDHPATAILGLRIQHSDTQGWRAACSTHEEAAAAAIRARMRIDSAPETATRRKRTAAGADESAAEGEHQGLFSTAPPALSLCPSEHKEC